MESVFSRVGLVSESNHRILNVAQPFRPDLVSIRNGFDESGTKRSNIGRFFTEKAS
jgi:hypothetical protein